MTSRSQGVLAAIAMTKLKVTATELVVGLTTAAWILGQSSGGGGDGQLTGTTVKPVEVLTAQVRPSGGRGQSMATPESARLLTLADLVSQVNRHERQGSKTSEMETGGAGGAPKR
jgi:hypothetical protein